MPVVRGDRIGESRRLNDCPPATQSFYAHFVATIPDDFSRFRLVPGLICAAMYPRREPTGRLLGSVKRHLAAMQKAGLFRTWEVDGVLFAELDPPRACGNHYHRTPEPTWSKHDHTETCLSTAISRAREWGTQQEVAILSNRLTELRRGRVAGASRGRCGSVAGEVREGGLSVPSVPSVLCTPPTPSLARGGEGAVESSPPPETEIRRRIWNASLQVLAVGGLASRSVRRRLRDAFLAGLSPDAVHNQILAGDYGGGSLESPANHTLRLRRVAREAIVRGVTVDESIELLREEIGQADTEAFREVFSEESSR